MKSDYFFYKKDYNEALKYIEKSIESARKYNSTIDLLNAFYLKRDILFELERPHDYRRIDDSIAKFEVLLSNLSNTTASELLERDKKDIKDITSVNFRNKVLFYFVIFIVAGVSIFIIYRLKSKNEILDTLMQDTKFKNSKMKIKLRNEIESKQNLQKKVLQSLKAKDFENLSQMQKELMLLNTDNTDNIDFLYHSIPENYINQFLSHLNKIEIIVNYLSDSEHYSNKEISRLLNKSYKSIESIKYRINKKMRVS